MTVIVTRTHINRPPDGVFDYVTTAKNWPSWHPSSLKVEGAGADHPGLVGEEVIEQSNWLFVRGRVKAESSQALRQLRRLLDQVG